MTPKMLEIPLPYQRPAKEIWKENNQMGGKISQFSYKNNEIHYNKEYKDSCNNFWKYHEKAHADYFTKLLGENNYNFNVTEEEIWEIRNEGYPNNDEERYAFDTQFRKLSQKGMGLKDIIKYLYEDYGDTLLEPHKQDFFIDMLKKYFPELTVDVFKKYSSSVENLTESLKTARQKYLDTGKVEEDMLTYFADNDPSKNYKYIEWMVGQFIENQDVDPEEIIALIQEFDIEVNKNKIKNKDVNAYNLESMLNVVQETSQEKTKSEEKREIKANEADIVFENDNYLVVVPETYKASCLYGKGTKWCTASTSNDKHWKDYTEQRVKFYYILNKNRDMDDPMYKIAVAVYPIITFNKKERVAFNDYTMEVFDAEDNSIDMSKILNDIPKNIFHNIIYLDNTTKEGIQQICEYYGIKTYTIYDDLTVDVEGDVSLARRGLSHIPLNFGVVSGSFYCSDNNLTSLEGAPQKVWGWFDCSDNNLTSLEGAPQEVGGAVRCSRNNLTTLEGAPRKVGRGFYCADNNLTTLEGAPQKVGGGFDCRNNNLTKEDIEWLKDNCEIGDEILSDFGIG